MRRPYIPVGAAVKLAVGSFLSDDRSDPGRPAVLPLILFADVDRDSLIGVALLFQLRFCPTAAPPLESAFAIAYAGPLSFFRPGSH